MDEDPLHYNAGLTLLSKGFNDVINSESHDKTLPYICLGTSGVRKPCFLKGCKRKWNIASGSLALGLGSSSTSCITMSSGRETRVESSDDLDLRINLLGNNVTFSSRKLSCDTANVLEARKPEIDLELSLSTCPAESGITFSSGNGSSLHHNSLVPLASLSTTLLIDEESASSRWKHGPLLLRYPVQKASVFPIKSLTLLVMFWLHQTSLLQ